MPPHKRRRVILKRSDGAREIKYIDSTDSSSTEMETTTQDVNVNKLIEILHLLCHHMSPHHLWILGSVCRSLWYNCRTNKYWKSRYTSDFGEDGCLLQKALNWPKAYFKRLALDNAMTNVHSNVINVEMRHIRVPKVVALRARVNSDQFLLLTEQAIEIRSIDGAVIRNVFKFERVKPSNIDAMNNLVAIQYSDSKFTVLLSLDNPKNIVKLKHDSKNTCVTVDNASPRIITCCSGKSALFVWEFNEGVWKNGKTIEMEFMPLCVTLAESICFVCGVNEVDQLVVCKIDVDKAVIDDSLILDLSGDDTPIGNSTNMALSPTLEYIAVHIVNKVFVVSVSDVLFKYLYNGSYMTISWSPCGNFLGWIDRSNEVSLIELRTRRRKVVGRIPGNCIGAKLLVVNGGAIVGTQSELIQYMW